MDKAWHQNSLVSGLVALESFPCHLWRAPRTNSRIGITYMILECRFAGIPWRLATTALKQGQLILTIKRLSKSSGLKLSLTIILTIQNTTLKDVLYCLILYALESHTREPDMKFCQKQMKVQYDSRTTNQTMTVVLTYPPYWHPVFYSVLTVPLTRKSATTKFQQKNMLRFYQSYGNWFNKRRKTRTYPRIRHQAFFLRVNRMIRIVHFLRWWIFTDRRIFLAPAHKFLN